MALTDSLVAYYSLADTTDAHGSNTLTNNNAVTFNTGIVGNGAYFARASSQYLSIADNADVSMGDIDFTLALWVYLQDLNDYAGLIHKDDAGSNREYGIYYDDFRGRFAHYVYSAAGATGNTEVLAAALGQPAAGNWYFVVTRHDATANTISICVNDGTVNSASHSGGAYNGTAPLQLGRLSPSNPLYFNGRLDEVGIWKRYVSDAEITELYNGGSGRDYAYIVGGGGGTGIVHPLFSHEGIHSAIFGGQVLR